LRQQEVAMAEKEPALQEAEEPELQEAEEPANQEEGGLAWPGQGDGTHTHKQPHLAVTGE